MAAGQAPDRQELLAAHPDVADDLAAFFADHDGVKQFAEPLRAPEPATQSEAETKPAGSSLGTVRYFGDYELLEEIARGGMGIVYKARQRSLNRVVALKMIRAGQLAGEHDVQRFRAEARIAANLQHPHIVAIHEVGEHDGQHYFSMDFVEGQSLADRIRESPLPPADAAGYVKAVAETIHFAHQHGTLHRDLKPSNILIDRFDQPRVTDFGLAKRMTTAEGLAGPAPLTLSGTVVGTPSYMPPEQASADRGNLSAVSDVYSLGAILYELVTGRPPFRAATPLDTLLQVLAEEAAPPRVLNPALARDLETIILKCLAKVPARRYATAQALADDLQAYLDGRAITARRPSLPEQTGRWVRRHWRVTAVAGLTAAAAMLLLVAGYFGWSWYRTRELGHVTFTTNGRHLLGEVLDENEETVLATFPVPTLRRISLPAGTHRLRLSASGLLSETWPLHVKRGDVQNHVVGLRQQWLWPPVEVQQFSLHELVERQGRVDLAIFSGRPDRLLLLDGRTGEQLWQITADKTSVPAGLELNEWRRILSGGFGQARRLAQQSPGLKGDGHGDLVLFCKDPAALVALSGANGSVLWCHQGRPSLPNGVDPKQVRWYEWSDIRLLGPPVVADVDGDGVPDLIGYYAMKSASYDLNGKRYHLSEPQGWVQAISGKNGAPLWRYTFKHQGGFPPRGVNEAALFLPREQLEIVRLQGRPAIVFLTDRMLCGLDLQTGKEIWSPFDLQLQPSQAPQLVDLDGDGEPDCLVTGYQAEGEHAQIIRAVALPRRQTLWQQPADRDVNPHCVRVCLAADLNGQGRADVVRAVHEQSAGSEKKSPFGRPSLEVLDGCTGRRRWLQQLTDGRLPTDMDVRFIVGPDLDGDGWRELFVASRGDADGLGACVDVIALSGADGRPLWRWRQRVAEPQSEPDPGGPPKWWQTGPDGWPLLLVPIRYGPGGQPTTFVLSAGTGRLVHVLRDVVQPEVADFNGDGIPDLCYTVAPQGAPRLMVLQGTPPEPWRQGRLAAGARPRWRRLHRFSSF